MPVWPIEGLETGLSFSLSDQYKDTELIRPPPHHWKELVDIVHSFIQN
jgi:hypothetical protein